MAMLAGTSRVDITPPPGAELSGFAARTQPSTAVLDPLHARGIYLAAGGERLLWVHVDLIGLPRELVQEFRRWARERLGLEERQVMVSATHTHSGPATIHILEAGKYDPGYVEVLRGRLKEAAGAAPGDPADCEVMAVEGRLDLAVDRRGKASAHTDPRVGAVGFRRGDGSFAAVLLNHPMHPVALGPSNRRISADVPGKRRWPCRGVSPARRRSWRALREG